MSSNFTSAADLTQLYEPRVFQASAGHSLPYRLLRPAKVEAGEKYPLVVFLHGAGERGDDNLKQLVHGCGDFATGENRKKYPAFVVAPQCPEKEQWVAVPWTAKEHQIPSEPSWPMKATLDLITQLEQEFPIDASRIYITGLSMGGYGAWDAIARSPQRFAAAAPVCGGGDPDTAETIKHVPIWAFHGDADQAVPVSRSRDMISALNEVGAEPKYTEYPGVGHNSWTATYANPKFMQWLFSQELR